MRIFSLLAALFVAFTPAARAGIIPYTIDGDGFRFGGVTVTGSFSFDTALRRAASASLVVSGTGTGRDGLYDTVLTSFPSTRSLTVLKSGSATGAERVFAVDIYMGADLGSPGPLATASVGLAEFENSRTVRALFFNSPFHHEGSVGTVSETAAAGTSVPLPAGLPLVLAGLGGLALLRPRQQA